MQVRLKGPTLTAVRARTSSVVDLVDGRKLPVLDRDWLISRGSQILDVVADTELQHRYDLVQDGGLRLSAETCRLIADRLGVQSTGSPEALVTAISRLAAIRIGGVEVRFTPGQLDELQFRATKRGQTVQQALEQVISRIADELFWRAPVAAETP